MTDETTESEAETPADEGTGQDGEAGGDDAASQGDPGDETDAS